MAKKIITLLKGRKCKFYGCKHILSIYNHDTFCRVHSAQGLNVLVSR